MNSALTSKFKGSRVVISKNVSANYTFDDVVEAVNVDASSVPVTITLPLISAGVGRVLTVRKIDSSGNAVTIATSGSDQFQGTGSVNLTEQWSVINIDNDGIQWHAATGAGDNTGGGGGGGGSGGGTPTVLAVQDIHPATAIPVGGESLIRSDNGLLSLSANGRAFRNLFDSLNVRDYGAVGDGSTDDSASFQAAITAANTVGIRKIFVPEGFYKINTSLNITAFTSPLKIVGASRALTQIKGHCTGRPIFDLVGSNNIDISNMWIEGDSTDTPSCAILQARTTGDAASGSHNHENLQVLGTYAVASLVSISSESNSYTNCNFTNTKAGTTGVAITGNDLWTMTSYIAVSATPPSGGNTTHRFLGGSITAGSNSGDTTSTVLLAENVKGLTSSGLLLQGYGIYTVHFKGTADGIDLSGIEADKAATTNGYYFDNTCTANRIRIANLNSLSPLYGATGSTVQNSYFSGTFATGPGSYQADFDTLNTSTIDLMGSALRVRTGCQDVQRLGDSHLDSYPSTTAGLDRRETISDPAGSGDTIHVRYINNKQKYDDRLYTSVLQASAIQNKPLYLSALVGTYTPNYWLASYYNTLLVGNVVIANPSAGPTGNAGLAQDGSKIVWQIVQDGSGHHSVTWGTNYKGASNYLIKQGANQSTIFEFTLGSDGLYYLTFTDAIDLRKTFNVMDFGAVGDGTTDDTAAINFALSTASSNSIGTVSLPSKTFLVNGITIPAAITLAGQGKFKTILKMPNSPGAIGVTLGDQSQLKDCTVNFYNGAQTHTDTIGTGNGTTTTFTGTLTDLPLVPGNLAILNNGVSVAVDDSQGGISGIGVTGTINYKTGAISVTFTSAPGAGHTIAANYWYQNVGIQMGGDFGSSNGDMIVDSVNVIDHFNANVGIRSRSCIVGKIRNSTVTSCYYGIKLEQNPSNGNQLATSITINGSNIANNNYGIKTAGETIISDSVIEGNVIGIADDLATASVYVSIKSYGNHWENGATNAQLPYGGAVNAVLTSHQAAVHGFYGDSFQGTQSAGDIISTNPQVTTVNCKFQKGITNYGPGYCDVIEPVYASPDNHVFQYSGGIIRVRSGSDVINVKDFGAKGDGTTDDTNAIKAVFALFSANTSTGGNPLGSGTIYFPQGTYVISSTIEYVGNSSFALIIEGDNHGVVGGTKFLWNGTNSGEERMFHFMAACNYTFKNFSLDCNAKAKYGIQLDSFNRNYPTNYAGSATGFIESVSIGNCRAVDGASGWLLGYIPSEGIANGVPVNNTLQVSEITWSNCIGGQQTLGASYDIAHWRALQGGNTKNFRVLGGSFQGGRYVFSNFGSGTCLIQNIAVAILNGSTSDYTKAAAAVYGFPGSIHIDGIEMEGNTNCRLVMDSGGNQGSVYNNYLIENCQYFASAPSSDDGVIYITGNAEIKSCILQNQRTTSSESRIFINADNNDGGGTGVVIDNCHFSNALYGVAPCYNLSQDQNIVDDRSIQRSNRVWSRNNSTVDGSTGVITALTDSVGSAPKFIGGQFLGTRPIDWVSGQSIAYTGQVSGLSMRQTLTYTAFLHGFPVQTVSLGYTPGVECIIKNVYVKITTPFTGIAGPIQVNVGTSNVNDGVSKGNEILSAQQTGIAGQYIGNLVSEFGPLMAGAAHNNPLFTTSTNLTCSLISSSGNLSGLTAGSLDVIITYEVL